MLIQRVVVLLCSLVVSSALLFGCNGPSTEDMQKQWQQNEETVQKYEAKYPAFKPVLDDLLATGKKDLEAAKTGDAKTSGARMGVVNDRVASAGKSFAAYEVESDRLAKLMKDPELNNLPAIKFNPANDAAKAAITKADSLMKDSKPANMGEAKGKIEDATRTLNQAANTLEALKAPKAAPVASGAAVASAVSSARPGASVAAAASAKKK
jgi:hypothetical protein